MSYIAPQDNLPELSSSWGHLICSVNSENIDPHSLYSCYCELLVSCQSLITAHFRKNLYLLKQLFEARIKGHGGKREGEGPLLLSVSKLACGHHSCLLTVEYLSKCWIIMIMAQNSLNQITMWPFPGCASRYKKSCRLKPQTETKHKLSYTVHSSMSSHQHRKFRIDPNTGVLYGWGWTTRAQDKHILHVMRGTRLLNAFHRKHLLKAHALAASGQGPWIL